MLNIILPHPVLIHMKKYRFWYFPYILVISYRYKIRLPSQLQLRRRSEDPETLSQASRISGIYPEALQVLQFFCARKHSVYILLSFG